MRSCFSKILEKLKKKDVAERDKEINLQGHFHFKLTYRPYHEKTYYVSNYAFFTLMHK